MRRRVEGLGLVASSRRKILDGAVYEKFFPKTINTDPILNENGTVYDTVEYCAKIVAGTLNDTKAITQLLLAKSNGDLNQLCKNIFNYTFNHYQYKIDKEGVEQLRRPSRAYKDRKTGIDCDCFSITISSILTNAGVPHYFRIVKMYNRNYYQHIYVVVPKTKGADMNDKKQYYAIDPVLDKYNFEAPDITDKKDRPMNNLGMPIQFLNGTDTVRFGEEFNGMDHELDGHRFHRDYLRRKKKHLENTRDMMIKDPKRFAPIYNVPVLKDMYGHLIKHWDNDVQREAALRHLALNEEKALRPELHGLGDIIHGPDDELFGLLNADYSGLTGLDGKKKKARAAAGGKKRKTGVFTKLKNADRMMKTDVKSLKSKDGRKAVFNKLKHSWLKTNPGLIPIRAGFLVGLKSNFGRIASRLYWGYFTLAEAQAAGVSADYHARATAALEKVSKFYFDKLGGDPKVMRRAIITGRAAKKSKQLAKKGKLNGIDELNGVYGLGEAYSTAALVGAGLTALTAVAGMISKMMKNKKGKEVTETGGEEESKTDFNDTNPGSQTVDNDYSSSRYNSEVNQSGGSDSGGGNDSSPSSNDGGPSYDDESDRGSGTSKKMIVNNADGSPADSPSDTPASEGPGANDVPENGGGDPPKPEEKGNGGMIAVLAAGAIAGFALMGKKKKEPAPGLHGPAKEKKVKKNVKPLKLS